MRSRRRCARNCRCQVQLLQKPSQSWTCVSWPGGGLLLADLHIITSLKMAFGRPKALLLQNACTALHEHRCTRT